VPRLETETKTLTSKAKFWPSVLLYKHAYPAASLPPSALPDLKLSKYIPAINCDDCKDTELFFGIEYSCFRSLFSCLFSVPATSAFVERVFSQGSIIKRSHRSKMSDSVLENLLFLRCNMQNL